MSEPSLAAAKRRARVRARDARRAAAAGATGAAEALAVKFLAALATVLDARAAAVVSGYVAIKDELDCGPLLAMLAARGHPLALPVVVARGQPLLFRRWSVGGALVAAAFGTHIPPASTEILRPEIVIVPLLAFDRGGGRLGYGAGYYDRTLTRLRREGAVLAVGVGYAAQELPHVPTGPNDERLDWIVTEADAFRCTW